MSYYLWYNYLVNHAFKESYCFKECVLSFFLLNLRLVRTFDIFNMLAVVFAIIALTIRSTQSS